MTRSKISDKINQLRKTMEEYCTHRNKTKNMNTLINIGKRGTGTRRTTSTGIKKEP